MSMYIAGVGGVATGTSALTLVQVAPSSNRPVTVVEVGVSFTSVTASDPPVLVELVRASNAGTSSSLSIIRAYDNDPKAPQSTAKQTFTAEPTLIEIVRQWEVTPVGGLFVVQFPVDREIKDLIYNIGIRVTSSVNQSATAYIGYEE